MAISPSIMIPASSILGQGGNFGIITVGFFVIAFLTTIIGFIISSNRRNVPANVARATAAPGTTTSTLFIILLLASVFASGLGFPGLGGGATMMFTVGTIREKPWVLVFPGLILIALVWWFIDYFNNWYTDTRRPWWGETEGDKVLRYVNQYSWIIFALLAFFHILNVLRVL